MRGFFGDTWLRGFFGETWLRRFFWPEDIDRLMIDSTEASKRIQ
jgi:hypothetical protein